MPICLTCWKPDSGVAPARKAWEDAGGTAPHFGAVNLGGGATPNGLGTTHKVQDSSWNEVGVECFGTCRIVGGTGSTAGTGGWTISGLPRRPKMNADATGVTGGNTRNVGYGFALCTTAGDYRYFVVTATVDPVWFGGNRLIADPVLYFHALPRLGVSVAGLTSAAVTGVLSTNTPQTIDTLQFAALGDFAQQVGSSPLGQNSSPFAWAAGSIVNLTFQYEGV